MPKEFVNHMVMESHECHEFLKRIHKGKFTRDELSAHVFAAVVPAAAHFSQAIAHAVNFYLDHDKRQEREEIVRLSSLQGDKEAVVRVMNFLQEALRK